MDQFVRGERAQGTTSKYLLTLIDLSLFTNQNKFSKKSFVKNFYKCRENTDLLFLKD